VSTSFSSEKSYSPSILMCAHDCGEWDLMAVIISTRAAGPICARNSRSVAPRSTAMSARQEIYASMGRRL